MKPGLSQSIEYENLADLNEDRAISEEEFNIYGVVIDGTFPYKGDKRFVATCKIID